MLTKIITLTSHNMYICFTRRRLVVRRLYKQLLLFDNHHVIAIPSLCNVNGIDNYGYFDIKESTISGCKYCEIKKSMIKFISLIYNSDIRILIYCMHLDSGSPARANGALLPKA